jgi:hypothetical protein
MRMETAHAGRSLFASDDCRLRQGHAAFIDVDCRRFNGRSTPAFITRIGSCSFERMF